MNSHNFEGGCKRGLKGGWERGKGKKGVKWTFYFYPPPPPERLPTTDNNSTRTTTTTTITIKRSKGGISFQFQLLLLVLHSRLPPSRHSQSVIAPGSWESWGVVSDSGGGGGVMNERLSLQYAATFSSLFFPTFFAFFKKSSKRGSNHVLTMTPVEYSRVGTRFIPKIKSAHAVYFDP